MIPAVVVYEFLRGQKDQQPDAFQTDLLISDVSIKVISSSKIIRFIYMVQHNYYVYITTNPSRTVLYTGVTNDLDRRLQEHLDDNMNDRKTFAGKYFCYNLVYYEWYSDIRSAIGREKEIKGWIRAKKEKLIESFNPAWRFLNDPQEIAKGDLPQWHVGDDYWQPGST